MEEREGTSKRNDATQGRQAPPLPAATPAAAEDVRPL